MDIYRLIDITAGIGVVSAATDAGPAPSLPNFFVIGAQKAGTSTLHQVLAQHPQAFMCDPKEPHYFAADREWARGQEWYRSLFAGAGDALAVGEASTTYAMYPHYSGVVERLVATVARPKLVYIVREPIARMRSAYLHGLARGSETRPIGIALTDDPRYLLTSSYALQASRWLARVPRSRMLLLSLEQLRDDPDATLARLFTFLGIDPTWRPPALPAANRSDAKRAPRGWWRALGAAAIRLEKTDWVPTWMARLNDRDVSAVRREVHPAELTVPPEVEARLRRALAPDHHRLRVLWDEANRPCWLEDEPTVPSIH